MDLEHAFYDILHGAGTVLTSQPTYPSASTLITRLRQLFGAPLPFCSAGNDFGDLYNEDGTALTIRFQEDVRPILLLTRPYRVLTRY